MEELKPCPFCGREVHLDSGAIKCNYCRLTFDGYGFCQDFTAERWNCRAKEENAVYLPCSIGTHLFKVTYPFKKEPKVTEFVVKNIRTVGKKHRILLEVQALNVPATSWMEFSKFYTTREEAEKELMNGRTDQSAVTVQ